MATTKKNTKPAKARPQLNRQTIKDLSVSGGLDRGVKGGMLPTKGVRCSPADRADPALTLAESHDVGVLRRDAGRVRGQPGADAPGRMSG